MKLVLRWLLEGSAPEGLLVDRLDLLLQRRGFFPSREKARRAVMAGMVEVEGRLIDKPGKAFPAGVKIEVRGPREPFVSRGGRKLAAALDYFRLTPQDRICTDVGASTGGFTDCLLQRGARRVYAIDVGYGQLDQRIREDPRVVVMERTNARYLQARLVPEPCDLVTLDLSFISLLKVVPAVLPLLRSGGWLLPLIKPQFEAGRGEVERGGVVKDPAARDRVVRDTVEAIEGLGVVCHGRFDSPVVGARSGNRETFALFRKGSKR
jgi:23S rRNA (cytidine1920-2'-O)/16S rRNA (cytidine1409-2'-O)-methyltransferase